MKIHPHQITRKKLCRSIMLACAASVSLLALAPCAQAQLPYTNNLRIWLKADAGVTTNGSGQVTSWLDQSANGNNAGAVTIGSALPPTLLPNNLNGKPVVHFDGNNTNALEIANNASQQPGLNSWTVFVVTKLLANTGVTPPIIGNGPVFGGDNGWDLGLFGGKAGSWFFGSTGYNYSLYPGLANTPLSTTSFDVLQLEENRITTNVNIYHQAVLDGSAGLGTPSEPGNVSASGPVLIGSTVVPEPGSSSRGVWSASIDLAEVIVYADVLSQANRDAVNHYLEQKYNLFIAAYHAPALISAERALLNSQQIKLLFGKPLSPSSVTNVANYSLNNGAKVWDAQLTADPSTVQISIAPGIDYPSTVTVITGVSDLNGNVVSNETALVAVPYYVPDGFGVATAGYEDTFSAPTFNTNWQSGLVNAGDPDGDYAFSNSFRLTNGVLSCSDISPVDDNFLIYVNTNYFGRTQEVLMHLTITAFDNNNPRGVAGAAVLVEADPVNTANMGGCDVVAVIPGYGGGPAYNFFHTYSDHVLDRDNVTDLQVVVGRSYWVRISSTPSTNGPNNTIRAKAWDGNGFQAEPASWEVQWDDTTTTPRAGYAAIRAGWSGQTLGLVNFDVEYILIKAPGLPSITPQLRTSLIPRYDLGVAVNGGNAILSWPSASSGYKLQYKSSLTDPLWNDVLTSIVPIGDKNTVTVPLAAKQFFRLIHP